MKKRIVPLLLALVLLVSLTGCMCVEGVVTIYKSGSAKVEMTMGFTSEALNALIQQGFEVDPSELTTFTRKGRQYQGYTETETYDDITDMNTENIKFSRGDNSFTLTIDNAQEVTQSGFEDLADADISEEQLAEIMAQSIYEITFKFPYNVSQTGGPNDGVSIVGTELTLDFTKMAPNSTYIFYAGSVYSFVDVNADAWYAPAIEYMKDSGIVEGYGDGKFGPNNTLMLSELCQIIYKAMGATYTSPYSTWWGYNAIRFCIENNIILTHGEITMANYNKAVTREEAVSALVRMQYALSKNGVAKYSDKVGAVRNAAQLNNACAAFYGKTGYNIYIAFEQPGTDIDARAEALYEEVFKSGLNGLVIVYWGGNTGYYAQNKAVWADFMTQYRDQLKLGKNASTALVDAINSYVHRAGATLSIPDLEQISPTYRDDIIAAYQMGLVHGNDSAGTFAPKTYLTRASICQIFYNIRWEKPGVN